MDKTSSDYDIELHNISQEEFHNCMEKLGANGVGKAFFVYKYNEFDISLPRCDSRYGIGHRAFEVKIESDIKKACHRRDFTINAMMIDLADFSLIDFFGGADDIECKIIRAVDEQTFADDSLRALRAVQFSARFGFRIEPNTVNICKNLSIDDLAKERIYIELYKLFKAKNLHFGLFYLAKTDLISKVFGIQLSKKDCFYICLELLRARSKSEYQSELLFLYILSIQLKISIVQLLSNLSAPSALVREARMQKRVPKKITNRFLLGLACVMPIKNWLGHYKYGVKKIALALDIWDKQFKPKVGSSDALEQGLKGVEIGKYLRRQRSIEIREYKKVINA
jgi:tRNA nucleotidyltransferase (CCA-adding enzyme)